MDLAQAALHKPECLCGKKPRVVPHVWLSVLAVFLSAVLLRTYDLGSPSLWFDEAFSWRLVRFPFYEMLERTGRDNHPPLYFALLKMWGFLFGESAFALRGLSALLGSLAVLLVYVFVQEAFYLANGATQCVIRRQRIGLLVAMLAAVSVFQVHWAREVRMYTLGTVLALLSSWALFRSIRLGNLKAWLVYALATLLFLYVHYYALFSVASQWIFLVGYIFVGGGSAYGQVRRGMLARGALVAVLAVVLGLLPWLPMFLSQRQQVQQEFWTQPVSLWAVAQVWYEMLVEPENANVVPVFACVVSLSCGAILVMSLRRAGAGEWFTFISATGPFVFSVAVSFIDTQVFHLRYFLFAHLFFLVALAVVLCQIPSRWERAGLCGVVLGLFVAIQARFRETLDLPNKPGSRAAAQLVVRKRAPTEPVVVCSPLLYFSFRYHTADRVPCWLYHHGQEVKHYEGNAALTPGDVISRCQLGMLTSPRVWVVNMSGGYWGEHRVLVPEHWKLESENSFSEPYRVQGRVRVLEYSTREGLQGTHKLRYGERLSQVLPEPGVIDGSAYDGLWFWTPLVLVVGLGVIVGGHVGNAE